MKSAKKAVKKQIKALNRQKKNLDERKKQANDLYRMAVIRLIELERAADELAERAAYIGVDAAASTGDRVYGELLAVTLEDIKEARLARAETDADLRLWQTQMFPLLDPLRHYKRMTEAENLACKRVSLAERRQGLSRKIKARETAVREMRYRHPSRPSPKEAERRLRMRMANGRIPESPHPIYPEDLRMAEVAKMETDLVNDKALLACIDDLLDRAATVLSMEEEKEALPEVVPFCERELALVAEAEKEREQRVQAEKQKKRSFFGLRKQTGEAEKEIPTEEKEGALALYIRRRAVEMQDADNWRSL